MNPLPSTQQMEELAETLPYFLANAVFQIDRFLNSEHDAKEFKETARKLAVTQLRIYKKNPVAFYVHNNQSFLIEYKTTTYPNVIFHWLYRIVMENKNPMATVRNVNSLIEVLTLAEHASPN